ncbi:Two-component sensor histidine kinase, contains HisKA and HATPase domains [Belnapia rosea]|nr:Two-component sensor histidine kinase, contains HisKA and HATPase domains [Belnapia rosea]
MISFSAFMSAIGRAQSLPPWLRVSLTGLVVISAFVLREALRNVLPHQNSFLMPILGVLFSATLFGSGSALLATFLSAFWIVWAYLPPIYSLVVEDERQLWALGLFVIISTFIGLVIGAFQATLLRLQEAHAALARTDAQRRLLLQEFRHRSRNDLQSLVALLLLRARAAPSSAAQDGLREAAEHAKALARVHTLLAQEAIHEDDPTSVDSRTFIEGLAMELARTHATEGLRPVVLTAMAEAHPIDSERAILVGLVLNECVTNALKYAFPDERPGRVRVQFIQLDRDFLLTIEDDGTGTPPEDQTAAGSRTRPLGTGLGTRLLRGMAAQLRGTFTRGPGPGGIGTHVEMRFPARVVGAREG